MNWDNPDFAQAVAALRKSQAAYDNFLKNQGRPSVLDSIEKNCQKAIEIFNRLKGIAPPEADIAGYSQKAYTLLANCQWTKQLQ